GAFRCFRQPARLSADLRHFGAGGREKRIAGGGPGAIYRLSAPDAGAAQKTARVVDLPDGSNHSGDLPDCVPGDLCGAELRVAVPQHGCETADGDGDFDCDRDDGTRLCAARLLSAVRGGSCGVLLVASRELAGTPGPLEDEVAGAGRFVDEVSGCAVLTRARDAIDGWYSAGAGARDERAFARQPATQESARPVRGAGAGR